MGSDRGLGLAIRGIAPLVILACVAAVNVAGISRVEDPINVLGCLRPFGEQQKCVSGRLRAADGGRRTDPAGDPSVKAGDRTTIYRALRVEAPGAIYLVSTPSPHIWGVSPLLLASLAGSSDVRMLPSGVGADAAKLLEPLPQALPVAARNLDFSVFSIRYRARLGEAPVEHVLVFSSGSDVLLIDVRLLPIDLADKALRVGR